MAVQFLAYLRVSSLCIKEGRLLLWTLAAKQLPGKEDIDHPSIHPSIDTTNRNSQRIMHLSCFLLLILNLQLFSTYPISTGLTDTDIDILKVLLQRLEESVPNVDQRVPARRDSLDSLNIEEAADGQQPQTGLDEEAIREFFLAKNLKSVGNNSPRKTSGCFGRRMDRIGSVSSLGCNTVGTPK